MKRIIFLLFLSFLTNIVLPTDIFAGQAKAQSSESVLRIPQHELEKGRGMLKLKEGNAYYYKLDLKNALISYFSALTFFEKAHCYQEMGEVYVGLGNINFYVRRKDRALSYYRKAISCFQLNENGKSIASVYEAICQTMYHLDNQPVDSAFLYMDKLLEYSRNQHDQYLEASAFMHKTRFCLLEKNSLPLKQKALAYCDSATVIALQLKDYRMIATLNIFLGKYYDRNMPLSDYTENLALSRTYYNKALQAAKRDGSTYLQALCLNQLSNVDACEGKFEPAELKQAQSEILLTHFFRFVWIKLPDQDSVPNAMGKVLDYFLARREITNLHRTRFNLAITKMEYKKGIDYLHLYYKSIDTMNAEQQGRQFELLIAENEAEAQAQKIRSLEQDNELSQIRLSRSRIIFTGIALGLLLISSSLLLLFQRKKLRADQRTVMLEQRLLRAQMNPHFIFNSLACIQNFMINEDTQKASLYLSKFSQLIRNILDNSLEEYVPLAKEISTIENYLALQRIRFAGSFGYEIIVNEEVDEEEMLIPPMLAQPFIENSIEHGIRHKSTSGHIKILFQLRGNMMYIEVEDDGIGRGKAHEIESKQASRHRSMATSITRDRIIILNKKQKNKISLEIIDLHDAQGQACGTRVKFGIPLRYR